MKSYDSMTQPMLAFVVNAAYFIDRKANFRVDAVRFLLFIFLLMGGILLLYSEFPHALASNDAKADIAYSSLLAVVLGSSVLFGQRIKLSEGVKYAAIWIGVILVCMLGYSYRDVILDSRIGAELIPGRPRMLADGEMQLRMGENGHFFVNGKVNGVPVRFLVDTGASDIVLSPGDAARAGYAVDALDFDRLYSTANGAGSGARIVLDSLHVGDYELTKVKASVNKAPMDESILGMTFLNQFKSYRVEGSTLTLIP